MVVRTRNAQVEECEGFGAQLVEEQARGDVGVVGFLFDQRARRHDEGRGDVALRDAVIHVAPGLLHDPAGVDVAQAGAGFVDERTHPAGVERMPFAIFADHLYIGRRCGRSLLGRLLLAHPRVLFSIQHIAARHLVFAAAHEREFDLILYVFDMDGAAGWEPPLENARDRLREFRYAFADARRCRGRSALGGEKRLRHRNRDLVVGVRHDGAVALDDPELSGCRGGKGWGDGLGRHISASVEQIGLA